MIPGHLLLPAPSPPAHRVRILHAETLASRGALRVTRLQAPKRLPLCSVNRLSSPVLWHCVGPRILERQESRQSRDRPVMLPNSGNETWIAQLGELQTFWLNPALDSAARNSQNTGGHVLCWSSHDSTL
ncbi:unnamed protein product [Caretta caretta]